MLDFWKVLSMVLYLDEIVLRNGWVMRSKFKIQVRINNVIRRHEQQFLCSLIPCFPCFVEYIWPRRNWRKWLSFHQLFSQENLVSLEGWISQHTVYLFNKHLPCSCHILDIVVNAEETMANGMFVLYLQENNILEEGEERLKIKRHMS